jgi:hypothetical protein
MRRPALTPDPYGDCPFSSLLWRTLWKSYLLSWRTKLAKLLCLKCFGRMCFVNFSFWAPRQCLPCVNHGPRCNVLRAPQNCHRHSPIARRSRPWGSPASYMAHQQNRSYCGSATSRRTCTTCEPGHGLAECAKLGLRGTHEIARAVRSRTLRLVGVHLGSDPQPRSLAPPR